jgi:hypothetical protein
VSQHKAMESRLLCWNQDCDQSSKIFLTAPKNLSLGDDRIASPCRHSTTVTEMPQLTASSLYLNAGFLLWRMRHSHSPLASNSLYCSGYEFTDKATTRHAKPTTRELSPSPINAPCLATTSCCVTAAVLCLPHLR